MNCPRDLRYSRSLVNSGTSGSCAVVGAGGGGRRTKHLTSHFSRDEGVGVGIGIGVDGPNGSAFVAMR